MQANFDRKIKLHDISKAAAMSSYHFIKTHKELYDETPFEYLTRQRLDFAKYLLAKTQIAIADIVINSGFENASSFTRLFRKNCGLAPSKFRLAFKTLK